MPKVDRNDHTSALGVTLLQLIVERDFRWIFRRVEHRDKGIDANVETVLGDTATGHYLALQIKAGASFFKEPTRVGWKFRGDPEHLKYWLAHKLPVVLVIVDVSEDKAYWATITQTAVKATAKGWSIEIPRSQRFDKGSAFALRRLAQARDPLEALMQTCAAHRDLLVHLKADGRVTVEFDEWVNKSSGRTDVKIFFDEKDTPQIEFSLFAAAVDKQLLQDLFPWAAAAIDEDFYEENEDVEPEAVFQDSESPGGYHVVDGERREDWRPYTSNGEVDTFRVRLTLNKVGKSFLTIADAAAKY